VNVLRRRGLLELAARHDGTQDSLLAWFRLARKAQWRGLDEVRKDLPSADQVGRVLIFNIQGNRCRLIVSVNYPGQRMKWA